MSALRPNLEDALAEWKARVEADKAQVDRLREVQDDNDFYAPIASSFRADPHRTNEPVLDIIRSFVRPDETWLDIGAGGGRYSLPIALLAKSLIAVEPSGGMLEVMRSGMAEHGISNIEIIQSRWPANLDVEADCSVVTFVGNDIADIGPFIDAMEKATRRMCMFVNLDRPPPSAIAPAFEYVHGEPRALLPAMPEFLSLLLAKGRLFEVRLVPRPAMSLASMDDLLPNARKQTWLRPGSEKDARLREYLEANVIVTDGRYSLTRDNGMIGVVTWSPR
jgi:SAM-dependent methyltransferase